MKVYYILINGGVKLMLSRLLFSCCEWFNFYRLPLHIPNSIFSSHLGLIHSFTGYKGSNETSSNIMCGEDIYMRMVDPGEVAQVSFSGCMAFWNGPVVDVAASWEYRIINSFQPARGTIWMQGTYKMKLHAPVPGWEAVADRNPGRVLTCENYLVSVLWKVEFSSSTYDPHSREGQIQVSSQEPRLQTLG